MKVAFFDSRAYDQAYYQTLAGNHQFIFITDSLNEQTIRMAAGCPAVCISPRNRVNEPMMEKLSEAGVELIVVRSSGFDNLDFVAAERQGITVKNLPGYSPHAVAEYTVALILALNRKIHLACDRINKGDFTIDGLIGFNLRGKTVGIIGMGRIGYAFAKIMKGFECNLLAYDLEQKAYVNKAGIRYTSLNELLGESDIVSIHSSLDYAAGTKIIDNKHLGLMRKEALLINTSRGKLVDAGAVLLALESGQLGGYAADVYQNEAGIFHRQFNSLGEIDDPLLEKLLNRTDVLITPNMAYFTREAMQQSVKTVSKELSFYEELHKRAGGDLMI